MAQRYLYVAFYILHLQTYRMPFIPFDPTPRRFLEVAAGRRGVAEGLVDFFTFLSQCSISLCGDEEYSRDCRACKATGAAALNNSFVRPSPSWAGGWYRDKLPPRMMMINDFLPNTNPFTTLYTFLARLNPMVTTLRPAPNLVSLPWLSAISTSTKSIRLRRNGNH